MTTQTDEPNAPTDRQPRHPRRRARPVLRLLARHQPARRSALPGAAWSAAMPANLPDGPFTDMGTLLSIQQLVRSQHQCLIAEIAFDPDVPARRRPVHLRQARAAQPRRSSTSRTPACSPSRRAPQTFEIRPTPAGRPVGFPHDELMIEWGDVPAGSSASIYLPASSASDILAIADQTYTSHRLTAPMRTRSVARPKASPMSPSRPGSRPRTSPDC